jgi:hypothetical protein
MVLFSINAFGQNAIRGSITDIATKMPIARANVKNIYTGGGMSTDSIGQFNIKCKAGELIEISHVGYNTVRVRIKSNTAEFYNIVMQPASRKIKEIVIREQTQNYVIDSIATADKYRIVLAQPSFDDYDLKNGVIGMLSKQQRQKWAFIEMMGNWEKEKYVDYMFNEKKIARWTKMPPEKLERFMRIYRPSYEFVRNTNEYTFMKYVKDCVANFCPNCSFEVN